MNQLVATLGPPPVRPGQSGRDEAADWRLASAIKESWRQGQTPDAAAALARYPALNAHRSVVVDLVYEEFCRREDGGERPEPQEYYSRFPSHQSVLRKLLEAHCFVDDLAAEPEPKPRAAWPYPGQTLLGVRLLRELGRGAFARVYLAKEPALGDRLVVLKVSPCGESEAMTLGPLSHSGIVPVHWANRDPASGLYVVCMAYQGSATLADVLDRVALSPEPPRTAQVFFDVIEELSPAEKPAEDPQGPDAFLQRANYIDGVAHLGAQLADALAFLHARGICHRDLKPSNVLLSSAGRPLLIDFNLSADERLGRRRPGGTVAYMAPEQLRELDPTGEGPAPDGRADVFSLGVILYELLCGKLPFGALPRNLSLAAFSRHLLERQAAGLEPLIGANSRVPPRLAKVIEGCLARDPGARPQTAAELATALRRCLAPRRRRLWPVLALAALVVGGGAGLVAYTQALRDPWQEGRAAFLDGRFEQAADFFTQVLQADSGNARALFARGQARKHQALAGDTTAQKGLWELARQDFERADELAPDGRAKAGQGFCLSRQGHYPAARVKFDQARAAGFRPAALFNDLGLSHLGCPESPLQERLAEAVRHFSLAIETDKALRAAWYNRALAYLEVSRHGFAPHPAWSLPEPQTAVRLGLCDVRKACALGSGEPDIDLLGARLGGMAVRAAALRSLAGAAGGDALGAACRYHALALLPGPSWSERVDESLTFARQAVEHGYDPGPLANDWFLAVLKAEPGFEELVRRKPVPGPRPRPFTRLVDPVPGIVD